MNCPHCGATTGVTRTRDHGDYVRRVRECPCGKEFATYEVVAAPYHPDTTSMGMLGDIATALQIAHQRILTIHHEIDVRNRERPKDR